MLSGVTGLINSIEMEDGSGQCFNVAMCENETLETKTVFIRCKPASFIQFTPPPGW
jgi:hypothetical protein